MGRADLSAAARGLGRKRKRCQEPFPGISALSVVPKKVPDTFSLGSAMARKMRRYTPGAITLPMFEHGVSGISYAFGTRSASWPPEVANGTPLRVVKVNQVHGADVLVITGRTYEPGPEASS